MVRQPAVAVVEGLVVRHQCGGELEIFLPPGAPSLGDQCQCAIGHLLQDGHRARLALPLLRRQGGHPHGQTTGSLPVGHDPQCRHQKAQIGGHRRLAGDQVVGLLFECDEERVNVGVAHHHDLGSHLVGLEQSRRGATHRVLGQ